MQQHPIRNLPSGSYHEIIPKQLNSPIILSYAKPHYTEHDSERAHLLSWHEQLEVKYFLRGGAEIICGTNCFLSETGDLLIINPYEYHKSRIFNPEHIPVYHLMSIDLDHPAVWAILRDNPALMGEGLPAIGPQRIPFLKNILRDPDATCVKLFLLLAEEYQRSGMEFDAFHENLLRAFLYSLIRDAANHDHAEQRKDPRTATNALLPALQYIDAHFRETIKIRDLADQCMLSTSRFSHLFKEVTGSGAIAYIQDLRISKAAVLLRTTDMTIGAIAEQVGFCDSAHFCRTFKRICGIAPNDYRYAKKSKTPLPQA